MTADTIFMQVRNEQLDNMLLVSNAFMVNTQLDSSKYNQVKGRRITGFFTDNALDRMFVDGNAESIYYTVNEKEQVYTNMYHSRSSRIKIVVDSNQIVEFNPIRGVDGKVYPIQLIPQEAEILDGFVWKPGDRPTSKADLLARRRPPADAPLAVPADSTDATTGQPPSAGRPVTDDSTRTEYPAQPADNVITDSIEIDRSAPHRLHLDQTPGDSLKPEPKPADSVAIKRISHDSILRDYIPLQAYLLRLRRRPNTQASRLYRPGPSNNIAKYPVRNAGANSCSPKRFQSCIDITTNMVMINGMVANRVNNPTISSTAQNNSAKIANPMDSGPPKPKKS